MRKFTPTEKGIGPESNISVNTVIIPPGNSTSPGDLDIFLLLHRAVIVAKQRWVTQYFTGPGPVLRV